MILCCGLQSPPCFAPRRFKVDRRSRSAGLALVPHLAQALHVFHAQLALELPVAECLADDFAGGGVFAGFDGGLQSANLLSGQSDTDFLNIRQSGALVCGALFTTFYYIVAIYPRVRIIYFDRKIWMTATLRAAKSQDAGGKTAAAIVSILELFLLSDDSPARTFAMESFFTRYRNYMVLLAVLLAQVIGLAVQVRRTDSGRNTLDPRDPTGVRLVRLWAETIVTPPERLFHGTKLNAIGVWENYIALRGVREQNQDLQKTIDRLRLEQASLLEDARQGERLQALVDFQQKYIYKTVAAQAIGSSGSESSRVFYIDKGADYKLERDMAVITADGIVGKVREVFPHTAQVLAINDQTSGAGVILETTRIRGILRGNAAGRPQIVGILKDDRIQPGEKVLTAGGDLVFPRGLPVGVVDRVMMDPERDAFIDVIVKPAAHLDRLDEVLVITSTEPRFSDEQKQDMTTSEALKGADAAAIKAQQKASQIMAERLPGLTDPNAPAAAATPGNSGAGTDQAAPVQPPAPKLIRPLHPDRFTPGAQPLPLQEAEGTAPADQQTKAAPQKPAAKTVQPVMPPPATDARSPQP